MANGSNDDRRKRNKPSKPGSVEDWLAQRLAMVGGDDDDDRSDPGQRSPPAVDAADEADEADEEAPTVRARVAEPPPRPTRLRPASEAPVARTIPPSRPGSTPPPAPDSLGTGPASDLDLPDFEAEPLATEDVEPLLTEEVEPIEAPSDTDEVQHGPGHGTPPWQAPDEAMWDLLGETTGSTATVSGSTVSGSTASVAVGAPGLPAGAIDAAPTPRSASRASQAATIPPASIKVGAAKSPPRPTLEPPGPELPRRVEAPEPELDLVSFDAEPPIRRTPGDEHPDVTVSSAADPVDALIAEASASPRPRRRRTAFSRTAEETPAGLAPGDPTPAEMGLVAGDTLTPEETEPPSPPSGFDEVFPISRGIPPVRARSARAVPPPVPDEPTSALLATDPGAPAPLGLAEAEPGTEWMPPSTEAPSEESEDDRTQIRPQTRAAPVRPEPARPEPSPLAETLPRPQERAEDRDDRDRSTLRALHDRPIVVPSARPARDADDESVDDDATQQRAVVLGGVLGGVQGVSGDAGAVTRRFHAPPDDESDLAGTLPPEVSSAVITWGSVIVGVLMFFVTMVLFALFIVPYLA